MRAVTEPARKLRRWVMARLPPGAGLPLHAYKAYYLTEPELRWALATVNPGDLVVDVGCNIGIYAFWFARRVGRSGKVIAIDPAPACVRYLRTAANQLGLSQLTIIGCGASDAHSTLELHIPLEHDGVRLARATFGPTLGPAHVLKVDVAPLDDILRDRDRPVSLIKCDVEGYELAVLR